MANHMPPTPENLPQQPTNRPPAQPSLRWALDDAQSVHLAIASADESAPAWFSRLMDSLPTFVSCGIAEANQAHEELFDLVTPDEERATGRVPTEMWDVIGTIPPPNDQEDQQTILDAIEWWQARARAAFAFSYEQREREINAETEAGYAAIGRNEA